MPLLALVFAAVAALDAPERARVDAVFKNYTSTTPGCALGIFRNGGIAYAHGYGMADLERHVPITPASVFEVGSVSKQFAAAAIIMLADRGKLTFNDDVRKFIPELPDYGAPITLNELMWHTSGLRDYTSLLTFSGYGLEDPTTDAQALAAIVRQRHLEFRSGTRYEYSNTNYFLLSVIVKRVTGLSLAQYVQRNVFQPLGMTHSLYRTNYAMLIPDRAMGYAPAANGFKNSMSNWQQTGDGGVQTSVQDAAKWDENFYRPAVGGEQLVTQLQATGHLTNGTRLDYARGLFIGDYRGLRSVTHGGAWIGYRAAFDRFPTVHTSVVVLCNSDDATPDALAQRVEDVVLARYLRPTAKAEAGRGAAKSSLPASAYAGSYFDEARGDVLHVKAHGDRLALSAGETEYPLTRVAGSSFRLGATPITFVTSSAGAVTGMRIDTGDDASSARKFEPVTPTPQQLTGASGRYYSPELDVTWVLRVDGATLSLEPARYLPDGAAGKLEPQMPDAFSSSAGFLIRFTRDAGGAIHGFTLSAGRGLSALEFARTP